MALAGPRSEFHSLRRYVRELENHFLANHLRPGGATLGPPSRRELLDAAAFVVLVHGALENFVEGVALWRLHKIVDGWASKKRAGRSTASLLLHQPAPVSGASTVYERLRFSLSDAKQSYSLLVANNHGIAMKHLHTLFDPLGVDLPNDPTLTASLEAVVSMRHDWAHKYRYGARVAKSAADAKVAVDDCLILADRLSREMVRTE